MGKVTPISFTALILSALKTLMYRFWTALLYGDPGLSVCLSVRPSARLYVCMHVCIYVYLVYMYVSLYLCVYQFVYVDRCMQIHV